MAAKEPHRLMRDRALDLPPAVARLLEQATAALDNHDPAGAEPDLVSVLQLAPDCTEARRMLGLVEHIRGNYAQSVVLLRQALEAKPGDALILMNLAASLHAKGEFDVALSCFRRATVLVPDFAPAWFNLGRMYMLQARPAGAITKTGVSVHFLTAARDDV
jgi:Flp pilus assembly protein TadD